MPQPIKYFSDDPSVTFGVEALKRYPQLALYVSAIVTSWSNVENAINLAFLMLVGSGSETAITIYQELSGSGSRDTAISAAARTALSKSDFELFCAVRRVLKRVGKQRNNVVHGMIGFCEQVPEAFVIVHQNDLFNQMNALFRKQHLSGDPEGVKAWASEQFRTTSIVYKAQDFHKIIERCHWAEAIAQELAVICAEVHPGKDKSREKLLSEPLISRALENVRGRSWTSCATARK